MVARAVFIVRAVFGGRRRGPAGNVNYPSLRLVTCGGPFDAAKGQDLDNVVVYAHLIS